MPDNFFYPNGVVSAFFKIRMNPLVKKEIRLLLPAWGVAMLLALIQAITRPYDFYVATLLFFGLTLMSLSSIGRETSLNTFSSLLSLPEERLRIWKIKLTVLSVAFSTVFAVWLLSFGFAFLNSVMNPTDTGSTYNLFVTICLIATATFTGGLWTALLLRQLAGAFWLTLLVPAVLSGVAAILLTNVESLDTTIIAVLAVIMGFYSVAGFFFARWLFFRAQDVGWSGGALVLPEWKFLASENTARHWKPFFASLKKELQLQQVSLFGAAGILVLHFGVLVWRTHHQFQPNSPGEVLSAIFWMLWLALPVVLGATAIAEERKLGVMESQLSLPVSRRRQFFLKAVVVIVLGTLLGGVIPMYMEHVAWVIAPKKSMFSESGAKLVPLAIVGLAAWLSVVSLFASSLARSFLQAVGFAIAAFFGCALLIPAFTEGRMFFFDAIPHWSALPMTIAVLTFFLTLLWLAWLNFKNFRDGWPLWRRNVLGLITAFVFTIVASILIYHRFWEVLEPAEPPHGPARLSLASPPVLKNEWGNLQVRLPDGRVWANHLIWPQGHSHLWQNFVRPRTPFAASSPGYVEGSNWTSMVTAYVGDFDPDSGMEPYAGYLNSVGIKPDGTLWVSRVSKDGSWTGNDMRQYGSETNWQQVVIYGSGVMLLKNNGTLWMWGTGQLNFSDPHNHWPDLRDHPISQIGSDNDWAELSQNDNLVQKTDGTVWSYYFTGKGRDIKLEHRPELDGVPFKTFSASGSGDHAYVRADGTLWLSRASRTDRNRNNYYTEFVQVGSQTNWVSAVASWRTLTALRTDGTISQWDFPAIWGNSSQPNEWLDHVQDHPYRIGIHNDWVALTGSAENIIVLAADGSLWYWPNRYNPGDLLAPPKQPEYLGNVLDSD